jgi:hypothetical protein
MRSAFFTVPQPLRRMMRTRKKDGRQHRRATASVAMLLSFTPLV